MTIDDDSWVVYHVWAASYESAMTYVKDTCLERVPYESRLRRSLDVTERYRRSVTENVINLGIFVS